ncbi:MAG TPA: DUF2911 domain-containing protein, partial [Longimicrobiaceae bacterium]|nr:DUF2911 domain-containing protein [Longimicrobiaceae bacterium]
AQPNAAADSAGLVTVLGSDTLALERWVRTPERVTAEAVVRSPRTTYRRYVLDLAPDGTMHRFQEWIWDPSDTTGTPLRTEMYEAEGGAWMRTLSQGDSVVGTRVQAPARSLPWVDLVHWPFELVLMRARGGQGGEAPLLSGGRPLAYTVAPAEGGGWTLTHPFRGPSTVRVDEQGRLLSLDAAGTTRKVIVTRVPWLELQEPVARWVQADREGRGMGELSGRGREDATVAGAHILVDYGQPQRRGRDIFPGVVQWGQVWRTGANRATHLTTDRALVLAGADGATLEVPAGEYTLFSIPQEDGGWLIVNRQTGQNGTQYDPAQDLGRVRMRRATVAEPVEAFTIRALPGEADGGVLRLSWDRSEFSVPFRVP